MTAHVPPCFHTGHFGNIFCGDIHAKKRWNACLGVLCLLERWKSFWTQHAPCTLQKRLESGTDAAQRRCSCPGGGFSGAARAEFPQRHDLLTHLVAPVGRRELLRGVWLFQRLAAPQHRRVRLPPPHRDVVQHCRGQDHLQQTRSSAETL